MKNREVAAMLNELADTMELLRTVVATLTTLHDAVEREGLGAPVITVIGKVVALRDEIGWFDRQPLFGK